MPPTALSGCEIGIRIWYHVTALVSPLGNLTCATILSVTLFLPTTRSPGRMDTLYSKYWSSWLMLLSRSTSSPSGNDVDADVCKPSSACDCSDVFEFPSGPLYML